MKRGDPGAAGGGGYQIRYSAHVYLDGPGGPGAPGQA